MSRLITITSLLFFALLLASSCYAGRLGKGRSLVLIGIGGYRGEFVHVVPVISSPWFSGMDEVGEVGGDIAYCRFLSDHWTLGIAGGYHESKSIENPMYDQVDDIYRTHSLTLRIGGDRYAFIDDRVAVYAGPGIIVTRGREMYELRPPAVGHGTSKGPFSTEIGLNGRIGMYAQLVGRAALFGHIGQVVSHTSARHGSTRWTWLSSAHEGSVGLAFDF